MQVRTQSRQDGSALIVAIVFLLLLSTLALAALRSSTTNVQIVGNMQARQEAQAAAQILIEQLISSPEFATNPNGVKDAQVDIKVATARLTEAPVCLRVRPVAVNDLDPTKETDAPCFGSAGIANPGLLPAAGAPAGSLCADTDWQINARGSDPRTGATVTLSQGVTVRRETVGLDAICK